MSVEAFLDTNVLVYCFEPGEPVKQRRARELVERAVQHGTAVLAQPCQFSVYLAQKPHAPPEWRSSSKLKIA